MKKQKKYMQSVFSFILQNALLYKANLEELPKWT